MQYLERKPFTVPVGKRKPADCAHGWADTKGRCVMCGEPIPKEETGEMKRR
jgi:hypothetical protein